MITITDVLKFRESIGDSWKGLLIQANMDFNLIYPVGSIYMSTNSTDPSLLFGGTWEQLENKFLLGAGSTYTAGDTGGSASNSHTHTLSHTHELASNGYAKMTIYTSGGYVAYREKSNVTAWTTTFKSGSGNNGESYSSGSTWGAELGGRTEGASTSTTSDANNTNNMPPYLVVYMWKRLTLAPHLPYPQNVLGDMAEVSTAFSIPAPGASVSYNMVGLTDEYELVKWNFSSSPENVPPADLTCDIYNGYFTITNNSGTTTETIKPLFIKSKKVAITAR